MAMFGKQSEKYSISHAEEIESMAGTGGNCDMRAELQLLKAMTDIDDNI